MPRIRIIGSDTTTGKLTLSDKGSTTTKRGRVVRWIISPKSGAIASISDIQKYPDSANVFSTDPHAVGGKSKNWKGTISKKIKVPAEETYYIDWIDCSGNTHRFDPKIRVRS